MIWWVLLGTVGALLVAWAEVIEREQRRHKRSPTALDLAHGPYGSLAAQLYPERSFRLSRTDVEALPAALLGEILMTRSRELIEAHGGKGSTVVSPDGEGGLLITYKPSRREVTAGDVRDEYVRRLRG